jgi:serine/threonine protein kinase
MEYDGNYITFLDYKKASKLNVSQLKTLFTNLLNGLYVLHEMNIMHHDIKLDNILINPKTLDIQYIDFGVSCDLTDTACASHKDVGTREYMAPEIKSDDITEAKFLNGKKVDIWSLGIVFFYILQKNPHLRTFNHIVDRMTEEDPTQRATIEQLLEDVNSIESDVSMSTTSGYHRSRSGSQERSESLATRPSHAFLQDVEMEST